MMSDETKQKVLLGSLLSVALGMGGWYLAFGGAGSAEQTEVMKERVQLVRHTDASGDKRPDKANRHKNANKPNQSRVKPDRARDPNRGRRPIPRREYKRGKRKSPKFTTPVASARAIDPVREA